MAPVETEAPPVGEEIHMPEPSLIPILNAVGLSLAIVGITLSMIVTAIGVVLFLVTTVRWVRDARHEISELPAEHRAAH
jgi:heme/copper-type cytochrome/quinol oxidase subunit 1